jgi:hypothetical protein
MINELSVSLSDKGIKLSKPVREFCESCISKDVKPGFSSQYKTLAEGWVHLVLVGLKNPNRSVDLPPSLKDPIKWRYIPSDWKAILLLNALCSEFRLDAGLEELGGKCLRRLENFADIGAEIEASNRT